MHLLFKQRNAGCENENCVRLKLAKNTCVAPGTGCMIGPNVFYRYLGAEGIPLVCPPCNLEECCRTPGVLRTDATHCSSYGRSLWHWKYHLSDSDKHMYYYKLPQNSTLRCMQYIDNKDLKLVKLVLSLCLVTHRTRVWGQICFLTCSPGQNASRDWNTGIDTVPLCICTHRYQSSNLV